MTKERATELARRLDVDLTSPGVCPACLLFVAFEVESGDERRVAGQITSMAPNLWAEGLGDSVRDALDRARGGVDVEEALRELEHAGFKSRIFRAVVRRLAAELSEEAQRSYLASLN